MAGNLLKISAFTALALVAFAANSILARMALGAGNIDAASYTIIRLLSGALILLAITHMTGQHSTSKSKGSWAGGLLLFTYALTFSYAYITLGTGTGALILFGAVQITMIIVALISGDRPGLPEWTGLFMAFGGFVFLVLPGVSTPSGLGFLLMTISGIAWGFYTLQGRKSENPLADTTYNFLRTMPLIGVVALATFTSSNYSTSGIVLATLSGSIASGLGYTMWYIALGGLSATQAAVLQLLVPVIAAFGGLIFVTEPITARLAISAILILLGILLVLLGRRARSQ